MNSLSSKQFVTLTSIGFVTSLGALNSGERGRGGGGGRGAAGGVAVNLCTLLCMSVVSALQFAGITRLHTGALLSCLVVSCVWPTLSSV